MAATDRGERPMEGHEPSRTDDAADRAGEDRRREHAADPIQQGSGFAEGLEHEPHEPDEDLEPDFARGLRADDDPGARRQGRFSDGLEDPDDPERTVERRFSEGIEQDPENE